jgi:hypothetical protein
MARGTMYSRTQNENGTYNSRCLYCFMTIAFSLESEKEHICPERALAELLAMEKAHEAQSHVS